MIRVISSFCDYFSPVCRALPEIKLPSAKKAALIGLAFFALYKLYRSFQSLSNRVRELEKDKKTLEESLKEANQKITLLDKKQTKQVQASETCDEDDNYLSAEEGENLNQQVTPDLSPPAIPPLKLFKKTFPGAHIPVTHQNSETTLANVLMKTLFRTGEVTSCVSDQPDTFTLSYNAPKSFAVTQLPQAIWNSMPWYITTIVTPLLNVGPKGQISQKIEVKFVVTGKGTKIKLDETSIFLMPNTLGYTGYLKSIFIPHIGTKRLRIETEHNSSQLDKIGSIGPQLLAEFIHLNFPNQ